MRSAIFFGMLFIAESNGLEKMEGDILTFFGTMAFAIMIMDVVDFLNACSRR